MIEDLASHNLQILDYRSKNKANDLNADAKDVAYLIHQRSEKLVKITLLW